MNPSYPENQFGNGIYLTTSLEETRDLGYKLGLGLTSGAIIGLSGPLGCGKTSLVQGLARGLGVAANCYITSPTFSLMNQYTGRLTLFHLDIYRLETLGDLDDLGMEDLLDVQAVLVIEWADRLPAGYLDLDLQITIRQMGETQRQFEFRKM